jgi:urease alpha subunit
MFYIFRFGPFVLLSKIVTQPIKNVKNTHSSFIVKASIRNTIQFEIKIKKNQKNQHKVKSIKKSDLSFITNIPKDLKLPHTQYVIFFHHLKHTSNNKKENDIVDNHAVSLRKIHFLYFD